MYTTVKQTLQFEKYNRSHEPVYYGELDILTLHIHYNDSEVPTGSLQ